ncbi:TetR/AcrR family transcriptional regulator [Micromonospora sp. WMMD1102]|uniref:TetR/AcrR family transcriptional regulator n=1 Tax=Micromonospora sp. WMMD1102 TaxID=3016105 RepID=UPI002415700E|nr:TetR/AcrR family transcriptional regulator [Micromonospora sp. WMMD1102]MDG4787577.1 TetR/AcrR family transcriptional regulator [Micromonospora sp. WMMD1102]
MTSVKAPETPRDRLLRAAADLFYREGIASTGVERLCQAAGVSKRTMYQLFETKDALVAESLATSGPAILAMHLSDETTGLAPRDRILGVFSRLDEMSGSPGFPGCPFLNTAVELRDPGHPASVVARDHKQRLSDFFAEQARLAGARDPETLAKQLTVVYDGSVGRAVTQGAGLDGLARLTASALLDAQLGTT